MVTLKDIAAKAGVSMMTVSRALNGNQNKVSSETAERIRALADEMGYIPNSSARSLAVRSSRIIAVIIRDTDQGNPLMDPYTSYFLGNVVQILEKQNYYIMVHFIRDYSDITFGLRSWNAQGALFLGVFDNEIRQIRQDNQIPLVFTDSYSNVRQMSNVGIDDYKGGCLAAEVLLSHGHRHVAFCGPLSGDTGVIAERLKGFSDTLRKNGCPLSQDQIYNIARIPAEKILDKLLGCAPAPTGLFASSDHIAWQFYNAARKLKVSIPEDLSIVGFDDIAQDQSMILGLTTIRQDIRLKAEQTCGILLRHLDSPKSPSESQILDVELIERESVRFI
ncbi:MAG TPA: LacI family transcriptional regulator [Candidatus Blautia faecavium]|uniref:LacI family transcriptional regulator n=1 Tax=Candidatus Blautia faecavium TaxID=2838487 RepID=A0A9D2LWS4_9FIRM|nr:LacI family transcriptional regulator [Candidatus Blautia faecavium]